MRNNAHARLLGLLFIAGVIGCNRAPAPKPADAPLEIAFQSGAQPQLRDVPDTARQVALNKAPPKPAATQQPVLKSSPAPSMAKAPQQERTVSTAVAAQPPAPVVVALAPQISKGTQLTVRASAPLCDSKAKEGDEFTGVLDQDAYGVSNAHLAAGTPVTFQIEKIKTLTDTTVSQPFVVHARSLEWDGATVSLDAEVQSVQIDRVKRPASKSTIAKGVIGGAIVGLLTGKGAKGAAVGAAAGAAVGTGVAMATRSYDLCVPAGGTIVLSLTSPLVKAP